MKKAQVHSISLKEVLFCDLSFETGEFSGKLRAELRVHFKNGKKISFERYLTHIPTEIKNGNNKLTINGFEYDLKNISNILLKDGYLLNVNGKYEELHDYYNLITSFNDIHKTANIFTP